MTNIAESYSGTKSELKQFLNPAPLIYSQINDVITDHSSQCYENQTQAVFVSFV